MKLFSQISFPARRMSYAVILLVLIVSGSLKLNAQTYDGYTLYAPQGGTKAYLMDIAGTNATSYQWTLPLGATITSGDNTNNILVSFSGSATSGVIAVRGTNNCGGGTLSPSLNITVALSVPATLAVADTIIRNGHSGCFNATQTITTGGGNGNFTVRAKGRNEKTINFKIIRE